MPSGTSIESSYVTSSDSSYNSKMQMERKIQDRKYSRAKRAAKKLNYDPSRDVL